MAEDQETTALLERMFQVVRPLIGGNGLVARNGIASLGRECLSCLEGLFNMSCPLRDAPRYSYRVLYVLSKLAEIERTDLCDKEIEYRLVKIAPSCDGLPADERLVRIFVRLYEGQSSPFVKIASAECVGRLRSGLSSAGRLFIPLFSHADDMVRRRAAMAVAAVMTAQARLATEWAGASEEFRSLYVSTICELDEFRAQLCAVARQDDLSSLLGEFGPLSDLDLLAYAQIRDEQCFRENRESLLRDHYGEFVAIRNGEIVGFAKTAEALEAQIADRIGADARVFVEKIAPEAFEERPPATIYMG